MSEEERIETAPERAARLKRIAMDLADGKIFSDRHIPEHEKSKIGHVFMPLIFGGLSHFDKDELEDKVNFIYEYYSESMPRGINGMPIFGSMRFLGKSDTVEMFRYHDKYVEAKERFEEDAS